MATRVGIRDVASAAGVSITTASHALNGKGRVPEITRRRVQAAAERLGYRANVHARSLAIGRTMTLAVQVAGGEGEVIVPDAAYFVDLLNGASAEALTLGYGLVLAPPGASPENVHRLQVDGAIVVDPTGAETMLGEPDLPIVTTGRIPGRRSDSAWVDNDFVADAQAVLDHLRDAGYQRPALLASSGPQSYIEDTIAGYQRWCAEHGAPQIVERVAGFPSEATAARSATRLLTRRRRPDAIYATLDRLAVGALIGANALDIAVPDALGIASLSDSPMLGSVKPSITAFDLRPDEVGREAVRLLISIIDRVDGEPTQVVVPSILMPRASTSPRPVHERA